MNANDKWRPYLAEEISKDYYKNLTEFLKNEINQGKTIYPSKENWFNALSINPEEVKVIILGQDPYHGPNQAHGYSFSVRKGVTPPPSLKNIYKEIEDEFNLPMDKTNGELTPWVEQGVMLLNSVLTVEKSSPASHKNRGWEQFTDAIIKTLSDNFENKVFMLWGNYAIAKKSIIDQSKHLILTSAHPSPYSANNGFFGNKHFIKANNYLKEHNLAEINWQI